MRFKHWIEPKECFIERRGQWNVNNTIVVDVQPEYSDYIHFDIKEFVNFLTQILQRKRKVLYFYNGETIGSNDSDAEIKHWLASSITNYYDDEYEEYEEVYSLLNNIYFYDKGYGFFRSWMDQGVDENELIQTIRLMINKRIYDSRELKEEELNQVAPNRPEHDSIYFPSINIAQLKQFSGAFLCGGERNECLKEVQILMNAMNIKYRLVSQFIY